MHVICCWVLLIAMQLLEGCMAATCTQEMKKKILPGGCWQEGLMNLKWLLFQTTVSGNTSLSEKHVKPPKLSKTAEDHILVSEKKTLV